MDVDVLLHAEVLGDAAPVGSVHETRMRLVDHHACPVAFGHLDDLGKASDVAVHRIDALDDHEALALGVLQLAVEFVRPVVSEESGVRLGEDRAVDDAGMDVLVHDDPVARSHEAGDESDVGAVAGREDHRGLLPEVPGERALELHVDVHRPTERGRARRAEPVLVDGGLRRGLDLGMV